LNKKFPSEDPARMKQSVKGLDFDCNNKVLLLNKYFSGVEHTSPRLSYSIIFLQPLSEHNLF